MSADYYSRLECGRGPQPSDRVVAAIARGLRLTLDERDHLFILAGHNAPVRPLQRDHVNPGIMRILDHLVGAPAMVATEIGEILVQTPLAVALYGDKTRYSGPGRSLIYRWFMEPTERERFEPADFDLHGHIHVAALRTVAARAGEKSAAWSLAEQLRSESSEFVRLWSEHEVGFHFPDEMRFIHPTVGRLTLNFQVLLDPDQSQRLVVFTAPFGTEDHQKLQMLAAVCDGVVSA
jgi:hypothetical protein